MSIGKFRMNRFHFGRFRTVANAEFVAGSSFRAARACRARGEGKLADVVLGAGAGPCDLRSSNAPRYNVDELKRYNVDELKESAFL
jgi:hypothetical protein